MLLICGKSLKRGLDGGESSHSTARRPVVCFLIVKDVEDSLVASGILLLDLERVRDGFESLLRDMFKLGSLKMLLFS